MLLYLYLSELTIIRDGYSTDRVEHPTANRKIAGSSPTMHIGHFLSLLFMMLFFYLKVCTTSFGRICKLSSGVLVNIIIQLLVPVTSLSLATL